VLALVVAYWGLVVVLMFVVAMVAAVAAVKVMMNPIVMESSSRKTTVHMSPYCYAVYMLLIHLPMSSRACLAWCSSCSCYRKRGLDEYAVHPANQAYLDAG
jgi:MFS-type transporter involved in bile tolerance (Atg22 family)